MSVAIWIIAAGLLAATAVIVLLAASKDARRGRSDNPAATDSGIYLMPGTTDFVSTSASDSTSAADNCDTGGWSDGSDSGGGDSGGDCGGGDGGGGGD